MKKILAIISVFFIVIVQAQVAPAITKAKNLEVSTQFSLGGKVIKKVSTDSTLKEASHTSLVTEGAVKKYVDNKINDVSPQFFGAVSDAFDTECSIGKESDLITFSKPVLNKNYVGKKIQIYGAGTGNLSLQTTIVEVLSSTRCRVLIKMKKTFVKIPCVIGTNSKNAILTSIANANEKGGKTVKISGNYLIGSSIDGDMTIDHFLNLNYSNFNYDFSGATIYGAVILCDTMGYSAVNNCTIQNLKVYCLGDRADATLGNTNWNGVGIVAGSNNTFTNISVFANGGVRGFSIQSENINGGIYNTQVNNFRFTGLYEYEKTDGFDVSGLLDNTINTLQINNVLLINCGRGFYCNSITPNSYFFNIVANNIQVSNCIKNCFRLFKIKDSKFSNLTLEKTGNNKSDAVELSNSKNIKITGLEIINKSSQTDFLLSTQDCDNSFLENIKLISKNISNNGLLLFSKNLQVTDLYIENVATGLYKGGFISLVKNYSYKNVTNVVRDNTMDKTLSLENVNEVFDNATSEKSDLSGFSAIAYCLFNSIAPNGLIIPMRSKNIASIIKKSEGIFNITFKYALKDLPIMAGSCRYYNGLKIPFINGSPTFTSIEVRTEDNTGKLGDSDYVSLVFY